MTSPATDEEQPPPAPTGRRRRQEPAGEELRRGQLVSYLHRDQLAGVGQDRERIGVVFGTDPLVIRPVDDFFLQVEDEDVLGVYDSDSGED